MVNFLAIVTLPCFRWAISMCGHSRFHQSAGVKRSNRACFWVSLDGAPSSETQKHAQWLSQLTGPTWSTVAFCATQQGAFPHSWQQHKVPGTSTILTLLGLSWVRTVGPLVARHKEEHPLYQWTCCLGRMLSWRYALGVWLGRIQTRHLLAENA